MQLIVCTALPHKSLCNRVTDSKETDSLRLRRPAMMNLAFVGENKECPPLVLCLSAPILTTTASISGLCLYPMHRTRDRDREFTDKLISHNLVGHYSLPYRKWTCGYISLENTTEPVTGELCWQSEPTTKPQRKFHKPWFIHFSECVLFRIYIRRVQRLFTWRLRNLGEVIRPGMHALMD